MILLNVNRIVPIYPLTENISQKQFRKIIKFALDNYIKYIDEYMPAAIREKYGLAGVRDSLFNAHFPADLVSLEAAKKRLVFDEFFFLQYALALRKSGLKENEAPVFRPGGLYAKVLSALPFTLTRAQQRVIEEIKSDFFSGKPMNRLIQGDVGSGKTVVALLAALIAADGGFQAAIMAPTEILASQHMRTISGFAEDTGIRTALLLGGSKKKERDEILLGLKTGGINIVIGTHSLIQDDVIFNNLGLAVIDEQHRFGVHAEGKAGKKRRAHAPHADNDGNSDTQDAVADRFRRYGHIQSLTNCRPAGNRYKQSCSQTMKKTGFTCS